MSAHGHTHDLAEHRLVRARPDVPASGQNGQAQQHCAQDDAEEQFCSLGPSCPGLLEQRDAVGDRLHTGQGAATS